jgi:agmatine/peptidylarginine deiminase
LKNIEKGIKIAENKFEANIGLQGGVIALEGDDMVVDITDNYFGRNMAYIEGNAIYSKGKGNVISIKNCIFEKNYGTNTGIGAALSFRGIS